MKRAFVAFSALAFLGSTAQIAQGQLNSAFLEGRANGGELGRFGASVADAGDLNGDGWPDLIAGAPFDDAQGADAGRAFIWFGGPRMSEVPDLILDDSSGGDWFGFCVAGIGDVDGDGKDDVAVGAPGDDRPNSKQGAVYVYYGGTNMNASVDVRLDGELGGDRFGWSISRAGDMNRDGIDDFVVGAPYNDAGGTDVGRVYLFLGSGSGVSAPADVVYTGETLGGPLNNSEFDDFAPDGLGITGPGFGWSVSEVIGFRGDGLAGFLVGAPGVQGAAGRAYLFHAASSPNTLPSTSAVSKFTNSTANERFGWSVSSAGFLDTGTRADVLIGAPGVNGDTGEVHVFLGTSSPPAEDSTANYVRSGETSGDRFGYSVCDVGDSDGVGGDDYLVGAPTRDEGGIEAGRVYRYSGTSSTRFDIAPANPSGSGVAGDHWGYAVAGLGSDLDGDGNPDLAVGAPDANNADVSIRGVVALLSEGPGIVPVPTVRLVSARMQGGWVSLDFDGELLATADMISLRVDGREIASLGRGIRPIPGGVVAEVEASDVSEREVELWWSSGTGFDSRVFTVPQLLPDAAYLHAPRPNPFNPRTVLKVELPTLARYSLRVVDLRGRVVRNLASGIDVGVFDVEFDGKDDAGRGLASGAYLAVLESEGRRSVQRMTLVE